MATPPYRKSNQTGSGFTNLQRVLQANRSNRLGSTVAGGITKAGQSAVGAINQAGQQFKSNVDAENARLASEKDRVGRVLGGNLAQTSEEDVNAFEGIRGGQTKADTTIKNADELAQKGREAQSLGQATGNEGGRFGLLQRYIGGGDRYTGGQQRLDNVLLGQTGQTDLRRARVATSGLSDKAQNVSFAAEQQGKELQNKARGLADETISRLGTSTMDYDTQLSQKAIQAAADREARVKEILSGDLEVEEPIYNQLSKVLDPKRDVLNTELNDYIKANLEKADKFGVQSQDDFNRIKMLQRLSGQDVKGDAGKLLEEYNLQRAGDVGAFEASDMFTVPSNIALNEGIAAKESEYGSKSATNRAQTQLATRFLADSQPDVYVQTGGYYNDLLNQYNAKMDVKNKTDMYNSLDPNKARQQYGTLETFLKSNPYNAGFRSNVIANQGNNNAFNAGSQYVDRVYGGDKDLIETAKKSGYIDQFTLNQIATYENQLKQAEAKQKQDEQFHRVGRILRKKPAAT